MRHAALILCVTAACSRDQPPSVTDPNLIGSADAFCRLLFEAPKRQLEGRCSPEDKKSDEYGKLVSLASRPVAACTAALGPGAQAGRLKLHKPAAEACARAIEAAPWKSSLRTRELAAYPECTGLSTGTQAEGLSCRTSLDCQPGLACAGASFHADGVCKKRGAAGEACEAPLLFLFGETAASCSAGHACDFGPFRPAYALGYPPLLSSQLERDLAKRRPIAAAPGADDAAHTVRQKALREAAEFGMIGLIDTSDASDAGAPEGSDAGRGEGIGLGSIGTGTGFGSGHGRLGSGPKGRPPAVRMGATSVSGRLPPEVIQRIVRQNFGRFRLCYENGLRSNPKLEGRVAVRFVIGRDGAVSAVSDGGSDLPDGGVVSCVVRSFQGLSFPQPEGGIVTVVYPILFTPGDAPPAGSSSAAGTFGRDEAPSASASAPPSSSVERDGSSPSTPDAPAEPAKAPGAALACIAAQPRGATCAASHHCADNMLCRAGRCDSPGKAGEVCASDVECDVDLYCGASSEHEGPRGVCKPLEPSGAECTHSGECRGACGPQGKCIALCGAG